MANNSKIDYTAASRGKLYEADKRWIWKFCFRVAATIFSLVGIGCVAWAVSTNAHVADKSQQAFWLVVWLLIPLGPSVIWNIINFIVLYVRKEPIHPGANVGVDLILWMAFVITGVIASFGVDEDFKSDGSIRYYYYSYTGARRSCPGFDSCDDAARALKHRGVVEAVGLAFAFAATVLHFALFVAACIEVDRINKAQRAQRAVAIAETIIAQMEERHQLPWQQPSYQSAPQPTYQPTQQYSHQPVQRYSNQPALQPTYQPQVRQLHRSSSPVSSEMTQVQPQQPHDTVDVIERQSPQYVPERSVIPSEVSSKGRNVLGLN